MATAQSTQAISLRRVSFGYDEELVISDASLDIDDLDFAWIVGPNGGGKTTLVKMLVGLLRPNSGTISILGEPPRRGRRAIGYMPQMAAIDRRFPVSALGLVLSGRVTNSHPRGRLSAVDREHAFASLERVGMADYASRHFAALSIGQQRRLLIARALAGEPRILLLDEPTANLDIRVEEELFDLLQELNRHLTIVMVSHDPAFVSPFIDSVVCVNRVVHVHPTSEVSNDILSELYGRPIRVIRHDRHVGEGEDG